MWPIAILAASLLLAAPPLDDGPTQRRSWDAARLAGSPDPPLPYKLVRSFPELPVQSPLTLTPEPGTSRLFILEHLQYWAGPGRLIAVADDQRTSRRTNLLDIDGLALGLAFHPNYQTNGYLFIGLNGPMAGRAKHSQVWRYTLDPRTPDRIDPASGRLIIEWTSNGHDGGDVAFGNDGFLYITTGDGSSDSDANLTGQDISDLQASVLRIDIDHTDGPRPYAIPRDNPFVDRPGARAELWCYGLRNPWRISHDPLTDQLWVGNNGQDSWEQVYLIRKGANYGWSVAEGGHPFRHQRPTGPDPISPPLADHPHSEARSLTGGQVYRGQRLPELVGAYIYGDWSTGRVWGLKLVDEQVVWHRLLADTPFSITGFGTDHAGELYLIDEITGFYRFEPTTDADRSSTPFPTRLSQTGFFATTDPLRLDRAVIPYDIIAPHWTDGATSAHALALPGLLRVEQKPQKNAGGAWTFPEGTVLAQTLSLDVANGNGESVPRRVETRLLTRRQGEWVGYSYRWNDGQTDAELVGDSGDSAAFEVNDAADPSGQREQIWRFPSRAECLACHSRAVGFVLGFTPAQLDRADVSGPTGRNQLAALEHLGVFAGTLPDRSESTRLVNPHDATAPLEQRARSYLDVNCATCHVKEGGGNALMELGLETPRGKMHLIDELPVHSNLGIDQARLITSGAPERSILFQRISRRGGDQMPPLMSTEVDRQAVDLIGRWIRGLAPESR